MSWRVATSLLTLMTEVNTRWPDRDRRTDGAISGYPGSISSHNVNSDGVVCAFDITTGDYPGGISTNDGMALAEQIRIAMRDQPRGIPCYPIHHMEPPYVPYAGPWIATANQNWAWQPYGGSDGHTSHIHVSVDWDIYTGGAPSGQADYDTTIPWGIRTLTGQSSDITPIDEDDMISDAQMKQLLDAIAGKELTYGDKTWFQTDSENRHQATRSVVNAKELTFNDKTWFQTDSENRHQATRDKVSGVPAAVLSQTFTVNGKTVNLAGMLASIDAKPTAVVTLTDAQVSAIADQLRATLPAATVAALAAKLA